MTRTKRIAILDLGTNTFHLIISEILFSANLPPQNTLIFSQKTYVKLASGGINTIEPAAWQRAMQTLQDFKQHLQDHQVLEVYAYATAGLRTASNGQLFVQTVKTDLNIDITLIDGNKEAELIWLGVRQSLEIGEKATLIMDIGGGSVEFIIANQHHIYWKKSYPIGAAVLRNVYHKKEPIQIENIMLLRQFLDDTLEEAKKMVKQHQCQTLIGASGTFDTLVDMQLAHFKQASRIEYAQNAYSIDLDYFKETLQFLKSSGLQQRLALNGMAAERAEMIVIACLLIEYVLHEMNLNSIMQSEFAMKQGILWEVMHGKA